MNLTEVRQFSHRHVVITKELFKNHIDSYIIDFPNISRMLLSNEVK